RRLDLAKWTSSKTSAILGQQTRDKLWIINTQTTETNSQGNQ
ncbi:2935_t:CDS:1, partial [Dentiscutata heterogama]